MGSSSRWFRMTSSDSFEIFADTDGPNRGFCRVRTRGVVVRM